MATSIDGFSVAKPLELPGTKYPYSPIERGSEKSLSPSVR